MINFIKKYCYITIPAFTIILLIIVNVKKTLINNDFDCSTVIQTSGTLIGFLFTAITILISLPKDTEYMKRIKKIGHNKIMGKCVYLGIIILTIDIIIWLLSVPKWMVVLGFIMGLEETLIAAYYTYRLCMDNF